MTVLDDVEETLAVALPHEVVGSIPTALTLRIVEGPDRGKCFTVRGSLITGGREPDGEASVHAITLRDRAVSVAHFELRRATAGFILRDLGSTNGTWVGQARLLPSSEGVLVFPRTEEKPGSTFRCGCTVLELGAQTSRRLAISTRDHLGHLHGSSLCMRELYAVIERVAPRSVHVLIGGETGTGKGAVARTIHELSGRTGKFVTLDATQLNPQLAESMILGHCKGAFTGATGDRVGFAEEADGGTLFIDEIGELPLDLQAKLLRVIDEKEVTRVGETTPRKVDIRIVCATHRTLHKEVAESRFRSDLFHRIAALTIELRPLRQRSEDIVRLAQHFLEQETSLVGGALRFTPEALAALERHAWPGNLRQLRNVVSLAAVMSDGEEIHAEDLQEFGHSYPPSSHTEGTGGPSSEHLDMTLRDAKNHFLKVYCTALLQRYDGNIAAAADHAGYGVKGFRELLLRLG